jgi:hypothetical protein
MTTQVQTQETRKVLFVNGVQTFRITVQCVDKGPMPDTHLFLLEIVDDNDPQQDVFTRIVQIADLDSLNTDPDEPGYKSDRSSAIASGKGYWRADTFTKDYTDLQTAEAAVLAISDRLNALSTDVATFDDSFKTSPEQDKFYPSADQSTIDALKAAYETSYTAYEDAQTTLVTTQTTLTTAETTLASSTTALEDWTNFQEAMQTSLDYLIGAQAGLNSLAVVYGKNFLADVDKFIEDYKHYFPRYQTRAIELTLSDVGGYTDLTTDDIGGRVTDSPGGGSSTGTLIAFNNDTRTWLVTPDQPYDDNLFAIANDVDLYTQPGTYWTMTQAAVIIIDSGEGPNLPELEAARNRFAVARLTGETNASTAASGVTEMTLTKSDVTTQVNTKSAEVTTAQAYVTTAQADLNKSQADLQTAYNNLEAAYDAVKAACPSWSPTDPFPPLP